MRTFYVIHPYYVSGIGGFHNSGVDSETRDVLPLTGSLYWIVWAGAGVEYLDAGDANQTPIMGNSGVVL